MMRLFFYVIFALMLASIMNDVDRIHDAYVCSNPLFAEKCA